MTCKKYAQTLAIVFAFAALAWSTSAHSQTTQETAAPQETETVETPKAPEVYQDGLMATVYTEDKKSATWASPTPVGIPIGEFVDKKVPLFAFTNLEQDKAVAAMFAGSHIGVEWTGYFHAEEDGDYVLGLERVTRDFFFANSCVADLSLSGESVVKNTFKNDREFNATRKSQNLKTATIRLEKGYYPLKLWLHCGISGNPNKLEKSWNSWLKTYSNTTWTLKVKRPSDRIVKAPSKGMLVWQ